MTDFVFRGKEFVYHHHLSVGHRELKVDAKRSVGKPDRDGNLIIQGDNLHALKALMPLYGGKVDCIYIDPPYNTGNEGWCYNDNVNAPLLRAWRRDNPVDNDDLLRHDKWCAMMWPRLQLLHELLSETGVIFVSIDDNEVHRLRCMMDEIWQERNFVAQFVWKKRTGANDAKNFISTDHEYILSYNKLPTTFNGIAKDLKNYTNPDNDPKGSWARDNLTCNKTSAERPNLFYDITDPETGIVYKCNPNRVWVYEQERMQRVINEGKVLFPKDRKGTPMYKRHKSELRSDKKPFGSVMGTKMGFVATKNLREILGRQAFDHPKPHDLIKQLIAQATNKDSIILDSFAGSGTTAHAVLALNREDGGNRKFILVEMEDPIANDVTAERMRRVIRGVPNARDEHLKHGLGGNFTYCTLGDELKVDDILTGNKLPDYRALAHILFYTATHQSLKDNTIREDRFYLGKAGERHVWMLYKADIDWLRSEAAALTLKRAKEIAKKDNKGEHLVFSPALYVSRKVLHEAGLERVQYAPLPPELFDLYRNSENDT